jgi:hypothetical protein
MPTNPKRRQKQLERKAAKRKDKQHHIARAKSVGLPERLTAAAAGPINDCWATEDLWTEGLGWVSLSRTMPNGSLAFAIFLVDRYCLGVKNAMANVCLRSEYEGEVKRKMRSDFGVRELSPEAARKLVEGAVAYARGLGLTAHPDYQRAKLLFGDIDPTASPDEFEFGQNGKPHFIAGPMDNQQRCTQVLTILRQSCGPDGFNVTMPAGAGNPVTGA